MRTIFLTLFLQRQSCLVLCFSMLHVLHIWALVGLNDHCDITFRFSIESLQLIVDTFSMSYRIQLPLLLFFMSCWMIQSFSLEVISCNPFAKCLHIYWFCRLLLYIELLKTSSLIDWSYHYWSFMHWVFIIASVLSLKRIKDMIASYGWFSTLFLSTMYPWHKQSSFIFATF
jgi:hypothetical protein